MTNRPEFVAATLAEAAVGGAIAVPVNFRLAPAEAAYILRDSGAALVVTDGPLAALAEAAVAGRTAGRPDGLDGLDGRADKTEVRCIMSFQGSYLYPGLPSSTGFPR